MNKVNKIQITGAITVYSYLSICVKMSDKNNIPVTDRWLYIKLLPNVDPEILAEIILYQLLRKV